MRQDPVEFERFNVAGSKEPRFVVKVEYTTSSPHFTSKKGIANVPGVPVQGVISKLSGVSQQLFPEDGRTTIGGFTFETSDLAGAVTDELRTQLQTNGEGIRGAKVEVFKGFSDDFTDPEWLLINSYIVTNVSTSGPGYKFACSDITREMNDTIFEQKKTTLGANVGIADATITVDDTSEFELVFHPGSFSDAPNQTVGYLELDSGEIVRYTGKTATTFTGVVRGLFGTAARSIEVDLTQSVDQRPRVLEFIYLEMPGPMLAYAITTGIILGVSPQPTLPAHWHTSVPTPFVRLSDFEGIGIDLYDPADETVGLILRFTHLAKTNGKAFVERQIHRLIGTYGPIYSTGEIGLKRMNRILSDAPLDAQLDHTNITVLGTLAHDQQKVINRFRVDWNWNGEDFTRRNLFIDNDSITTHGEAPIKVLQFRGLHGARHTVPLLQQLTDQFRDRFSGPPQILAVTILPSLELIEVGDVVRVVSAGLRDYAGTDTLDRSFEVQRRTEELETGRVKLSLFASSQLKTEVSATGVDPALPDAWYPQEGTDLDSLAQVTGGAITANLTLTGTSDMNAAASIWYHLGALTLNAGITLTLVGNVQLRIRGFFTVNGDIDGIGGGIAGSADAGPLGSPPSRTPGETGFVGSTRSGDGLEFVGTTGPTTPDLFRTLPGQLVSAQSSFPTIILNVVTDATPSPDVITLQGIPGDQRGTGGSHGAGIVNDLSDLVGPLTVALGGTGGDGGAGLAIVCRGLGTGVAAGIDLGGDPGTAPAQTTVGGTDVFPGSGAGGGTGSFLILLDGNALAVPDLTGKYVTASGDTPTQGTPGVFGGSFLNFPGPEPFSGVATHQAFANKDNSNSTLRIQYVPQETTAEEDQDTGPSPPTNVAIRQANFGNQLSWSVEDSTLATEIFASITNDRTDSLLVGSVTAQSFFHDTAVDIVTYYWLRTVDADGNVSPFENGGASPDTTSALIARAGGIEALIRDPFFSRSTDPIKPENGGAPFPFDDNDYWFTENTSAVSPQEAQFTHFVTGGMVGGYLEWVRTGGAGTASVQLVPHEQTRIAQNAFYSVTIRMRKRSDFTIVGGLSPSGAQFTLRVGNQNETGALRTDHGTVTIDAGPWTVDVWQEINVIARLAPAAGGGGSGGGSGKPQPPSDAGRPFIFVKIDDLGTEGFTGTVEIDSITVAEMGVEFQGAAKAGVVPDPVTEVGAFLKDDGTWDTPTGGGAQLPAAVDHDMAYFSAVPSPDDWVASSALTGASDYVRFGSPTGLNVRLYRNQIEARGLVGQIPANLRINPAGGVAQFGSDVGFATEIRTTTPGGLNFVNSISDIRWGGVPKIAFDNSPDQVLILTDLHVNDEAGGNQAVIIGEETTVRDAAQDGILELWGEDSSTLRSYRITNFGALVRHDMQTGLDLEFENDGAWLFDIRDGPTVRIRNATDTDWGEFLHDDTDFVANFVNTGDWILNDITDLKIVNTAVSPNTVETVLTDADTKRSIEVNAADLQLVGDVDSPGNNQVYGTNGAGARVWKADPTGGAGEKRSIELDAGDHQFVNDVDSPGNNQVYGTSGAGVRGWKADPAGGGATISQNATQLRHENSTSQISIFNDFSPDGISIPGIGVGEIARIELYGSCFNNQGGAQTVQWAMVLGGTTFYDMSTGALRQTWVSTTLRRPWRLTIEIANRSATQALINMNGMIAGPTNFPSTGRGAFRRYTERGSDFYAASPMESAGAINVDMATAKQLDILITFGAASANLEITREFYEIRTP